MHENICHPRYVLDTIVLLSLREAAAIGKRA